MAKKLSCPLAICLRSRIVCVAISSPLIMSAPAADLPPSASPASSAPGFAAVFARLGPQTAALDAFLREQLAAFEPEIRAMADYCIDTSGKRIRPALVFLSGGAAEAAPALDLVKVAAVVELVHLATLVHDDIMDGADVRRARPTASRQYGPEAAVLLGDALFAHALHLAALFPTPEVCAAVADSTRKVCAGEIVQTLRRRSTAITREDYYRVIDLKTAELFRVSCHLGARLGGLPDDFVQAAARFGRHLGIGYQIYDDLSDFFGTQQRIGKTLGTDLLTGKVTLPLLLLLAALPTGERDDLLAELEGRRPPVLEQRLAQMRAAGVFAGVVAAVEAELALAEAALAPHRARVQAQQLLALTGVLRAQLAALGA
jgi:octaprenyl-diphosphate synthase